jgi:hypothetical protein
MAKQKQKQAHELQQPGPGLSTSDVAFSYVRKEVAQSNERTHQAARKLRSAREREQVLRRRRLDD